MCKLGKWRQEVLNVRLSDVLNEMGVETKAEEIYKRHAPDFICRHPQLGRVLGEAEYEAPDARQKLETRVEERFKDFRFDDFDVIFLLIYPLHLKEEDNLKSALENSNLAIGLANRKEHQIVWYENKVKPRQIPQAIQELSKSLPALRKSPQEVASILVNLIENSPKAVRTKGNWESIWKEVGRNFEIDPEVLNNKPKFTELVVKTFFILSATSLIIYELSRRHWLGKEAQTSPQGLRNSLQRLKKIDYSESLELILRVLKLVPSDPDLQNHISKIYRQITENVEIFRRSGWEVLTYVYQSLLSKTYRDAYATFYTKFPAASLLARLAIDDSSMTVLDPACGTGSLLLASYNRRMWLALGRSPSTGKTLLEEVSEDILTRTTGLDALNASKNIAGAVLTIASLGIPREPLSLFHVRVGRDSAGSLNFFNPNTKTLKEKLRKKYSLVIMNPPFTRSDRIPNLIGQEARRWLGNAELKFGKVKISNIFSAGLAKPFMSLADALSERLIAAVLPNSILSRSGWRDIREGLAKSWKINFIVLSWAKGIPNFSSQTDFREIMCVVSRKDGKEEIPLRVINLLKSIDEMDEVDITLIDRAAKIGQRAVWRRSNILATINTFTQDDVKKLVDNLYRLVAFLDPKLSELHKAFLKCSKRFGAVFKIGSEIDHKTGLEIGKDIEVKRGVKWSKAIWGSGKKALVKSSKTKPKYKVVAMDESKAVVKFWKEQKTFYASQMFLLRRGQLDTQYVLAFTTEEPAVSNVWWPLKTKVNKRTAEATILFLNSTFGLIHLLGERLETRGLWVEYKKGHLQEMLLPLVSKSQAKEVFSTTERKHGFTSADLLEGEFTNRLDMYLEAMAKLEKEEGDFEKALQRAISEKTDHRAKIDLFVLEMLRGLGVNIRQIVGKKLFEITLDEVNILNSIMDSRSKSAEIKDKGKRKLDFVFQRKLQEYS